MQVTLDRGVAREERRVIQQRIPRASSAGSRNSSGGSDDSHDDGGSLKWVAPEVRLGLSCGFR